MLFRRVPTVKWSEVESNLQIIDVREKHEYALNGLKGALNIPLSQIHAYKSNESVYVYCQSGMRSKQAVRILRKSGIDAINIKGGIMSYGK